MGKTRGVLTTLPNGAEQISVKLRETYMLPYVHRIERYGTDGSALHSLLVSLSTAARGLSRRSFATYAY